VNKTRKKLALNRDTMRNLSTPALGAVAAAGTGSVPQCTVYVSCGGTCQSCITCTVCPSCGWNCTVYC
jgi:hypothetical protein